MTDTITPQPDELDTLAAAPAAAPAVGLESLEPPQAAPTQAAEETAAETPLIPAPPIDTLGILADLAERERTLATRERQFHARQHALALGLDAAILAHFDYSSDDALQNSLQIATLAMRSTAGILPAAVPAAAKPPAPAFATYLERARLFQEDPVAYKQMIDQAT